MSPIRQFRRVPPGFALIDALIAVVILATGILALTFLQVNLLRSAANARERSVAVTVAQNVLEQQRATGIASSASYQSLDTQGQFSSGTCNFSASGALVPADTTGLPSDYRYCVTVQRYRANGATFEAVGTSGPGAPAYGGVVAEYKQIMVDIGWRNERGEWSSLRLGDAISGIPLINSNDLANRPLDGGSLLGPPQVRYDLSDLTENTNFIPIAVGETDQQVAATNPTPKVIGGGIAETSFQIYTYAAASDLANVQRQVDTRVIGCKCTSRSATALPPPADSTSSEGFLTRPVRPSYWNGSAYTEPKAASYSASVLVGSPRVGANQSEYCDLCCRDHHDPNGLASGTPRVDPYRSVHAHYTNAADASTLVASAGVDYEEVCRVVRVNGIYRVTQDPTFDHFAYLPTNNNAVSYSTSSMTSNYQNFVQQFMQARILPTSGFAWNADVAAEVASLEDSNQLNSQASAAIDLSQNDRRYLQNRGILLDDLSSEAKSAINECIGQTGTGAPSDLACVLRHTSFASVNLTDLSRWSAVRDDGGTGAVPITIAPKNFSVSTPTGAPVAGQVRDASGAEANVVARALAAVSRSISTLADKVPVFAEAVTDAVWTRSDRQDFRYIGGTRPSTKFRVNVVSLSYFDNRTGDSSAPYIGWFRGSSPATASVSEDCTRIAGTTLFECDLGDAANAVGVKLRLLNFYEQRTPLNNGAECNVVRRVRADTPRCNLHRPTAVVGPLGAISFSSPAWRTPSTAGAPRIDEVTIDLGTVVPTSPPAAPVSYTVTFETNSSNPLVASYTCNVLTGQPVFSFNDGECRQ